MSRPKGSQVGAEWVRGASGNRECQGASWSQILKDVGDWGLLGEWGHLPLLLWPCTFSVCVLQASCWASHCPGLPPLPAASSPHPAPSSTHRRHWLPSSVYHLHGPLGPPGAQKPPPPVPMLLPWLRCSLLGWGTWAAFSVREAPTVWVPATFVMPPSWCPRGLRGLASSLNGSSHENGLLFLYNLVLAPSSSLSISVSARWECLQ